MSKSAGAETRDRPVAVRRRGLLGPLVAVLLLLRAGSSASAADEAGQRAFEAGQFAEAVRLWRLAAEAGDEEASFQLGLSYDLGKGVVQDDHQACRFYTEAAERGHVVAAFNTAVMQDSGRCGDGRDAGLVATWYARAAANGMGRAQFNLAQLYASGDGVPRNGAVAAAWYRAAAANGIPAAAGRAGDARRPGDGTGPLLPAVPAYPGEGQSLSRDEPAVLVWTAPDQDERVRFFVEIYALFPTGPVEVAGQWLDLTAFRIDLPTDAGRFTWRVLTAGGRPLRYTVGPWRDFATKPAGARR